MTLRDYEELATAECAQQGIRDTWAAAYVCRVRVPALIAERDMALALAERRAGECDTLRAMLTRREVQWANGSDHDGLCPICDAWEHDGHAEGCALAALVAAPPPATAAMGEDAGGMR